MPMCSSDDLIRRGDIMPIMNEFGFGGTMMADAIAAIPAASPEPALVNEEAVAEAMEGGGFWKSCSGCHESNEGVPTGTYSKELKCFLGGGCYECGGIGAIWDNTDYSAFGEPSDAPPEPVVRAIKWQSMDTAPEGEITDEVSIRGTSEWFLGRVSPEFRKFRPPFVVIRRCAWPHGDAWECAGEARYVPRFFDGWADLSAITLRPEAEVRAEGWAAAVEAAASIEFARVLAGCAYDYAMQKDPGFFARFNSERGIYTRDEYIFEFWPKHVADETACSEAIRAINPPADLAPLLAARDARIREQALLEAAAEAERTGTCLLPSGHFLSERCRDAILALIGGDA